VSPPGADVRVEELADDAPLEPWVAVLREAFGTVAAAFGWTEKTVPSNAAFTTVAGLAGQRAAKGLRLLGLTVDGRPAGFAALERGPEGTFYVERVAVVPGHRHGGLGRRLMDHACALIRAAGGRKASIGVVAENAVLLRWYEAQGFRVTGTRRFPHLPFTVSFLEKELA
jgi:ribosomal protein S18 acetylase RimI-like enzyme